MAAAPGEFVDALRARVEILGVKAFVREFLAPYPPTLPDDEAATMSSVPGADQSKYPAEQARRPAPSTEIKAQVFREREAAARRESGANAREREEEGR